jgi:hypothetical protein
LAFAAAQVYGWKVFYLDCKGDDDTAAQFHATMHAAGRAVARFPTAAYDGWRGDATAFSTSASYLWMVQYGERFIRSTKEAEQAHAHDSAHGCAPTLEAASAPLSPA